MNVLKKRYGDQFQEINVDEISSNLKNKIKKNVKVLVVRSYSMDQLLETNQHAAIKTIQNTFDKIKFSLNKSPCFWPNNDIIIFIILYN